MNRYQSISSLGSPNGVSVDVLGAIRLIQSKKTRILPSEICNTLEKVAEIPVVPHMYSKENTHKQNNSENVQTFLQGFTDPKVWKGNVVIPGNFDQIPHIEFSEQNCNNHLNSPYALPWNVSFTRHTTSYIWGSRTYPLHIPLAVHYDASTCPLLRCNPSQHVKTLPKKKRLSTEWSWTSERGSKLPRSRTTCTPSSCSEYGGMEQTRSTSCRCPFVHSEMIDAARDNWLISTQWHTIANQPLTRKLHAAQAIHLGFQQRRRSEYKY